jgi:hypothetical protein
VFSPTLAKEFDIKQDKGDITGLVEIQIMKLNFFSGDNYGQFKSFIY